LFFATKRHKRYRPYNPVPQKRWGGTTKNTEDTKKVGDGGFGEGKRWGGTTKNTEDTKKVGDGGFGEGKS
jgi:hypothetical protein